MSIAGERILSPMKIFKTILSPLKPLLHQGLPLLMKEMKEFIYFSEEKNKRVTTGAEENFSSPCKIKNVLIKN